MEGEEVKLSLYADSMTLYEENPKDSTQKLLDLINEFSKVARYKINIQKVFAILYTKNEISERQYLLKLTSKKKERKRKNLGINLTKEVKDIRQEL